ncbi:hypothetical protein QFC20_007015 [Naganishia adeliensis]|uniref:Uncharacterized protein n=1 Tax=Naganishia adeliensis TaxID=92952 RepID=A0ACC2V4P2_9TREE|nr:hypothetical protein QFC20_007015 [Naganishia adeliensis]
MDKTTSTIAPFPAGEELREEKIGEMTWETLIRKIEHGLLSLGFQSTLAGHVASREAARAWIQEYTELAMRYEKDVPKGFARYSAHLRRVSLAVGSIFADYLRRGQYHHMRSAGKFVHKTFLKSWGNEFRTVTRIGFDLRVDEYLSLKQSFARDLASSGSILLPTISNGQSQTEPDASMHSNSSAWATALGLTAEEFANIEGLATWHSPDGISSLAPD